LLYFDLFFGFRVRCLVDLLKDEEEPEEVQSTKDGIKYQYHIDTNAYEKRVRLSIMITSKGRVKPCTDQPNQKHTSKH
jgi:hypothetical protein